MLTLSNLSPTLLVAIVPPCPASTPCPPEVPVQSSPGPEQAADRARHPARGSRTLHDGNLVCRTLIFRPGPCWPRSTTPQPIVQSHRAPEPASPVFASHQSCQSPTTDWAVTTFLCRPGRSPWGHFLGSHIPHRGDDHLRNPLQSLISCHHLSSGATFESSYTHTHCVTANCLCLRLSTAISFPLRPTRPQFYRQLWLNVDGAQPLVRAWACLGFWVWPAASFPN